MSTADFMLYIHIPFCERKCLYCDFLSFRTSIGICRDYIDKLCAEIRVQGKAYADRHVTSVYVGGGTPSIIPPELMKKLFSALRKSFDIDENAEISMEINPGTLSRERIAAYRECGINRVSLGLQSASDEELETLGRIHSFETFLNGFQAMRLAGFKNINVDIMSGIPGQTLNSLKTTLKRVAALRPEHISAYSLILEEGTPFYSRYVSKETDGDWPSLPDEDTEREMYYITRDILKSHGYDRYEISNYARPGMECRHNTGYWTGAQYIGMGLGASSYVAGFRYKNTSDIKEYLKLPFTDPGDAARDIEKLSKADEMAEFMYLGLRMSRGISTAEFKDRFGTEIENVYGRVIDAQMKKGLIWTEGDRVCLTDLGVDVSNQVFVEFLP